MILSKSVSAHDFKIKERIIKYEGVIFIKVIKNNFIKNNIEIEEVKPVMIHTFCEHCDSELEISEEDTHIGWLGAAFVKCPCCGQESMVDELEGITLTKNNIDYPIHFNRTNKDLRNVVEVKKMK